MPELTRRPDWERRLAAVVNGNRDRPYGYGVFDCAIFARMAVEAVTGVELLAGIDPPKGWLGAAKFMIARGWDDVEAMATELIGAPCEAHLSRRGDLVSFREGGELHLAVRVGGEALTPSSLGLRTVGPSHWCRAWKIG